MGATQMFYLVGNGAEDETAKLYDYLEKAWFIRRAMLASPVKYTSTINWDDNIFKTVKLETDIERQVYIGNNNNEPSTMVLTTGTILLSYTFINTQPNLAAISMYIMEYAKIAKIQIGSFDNHKFQYFINGRETYTVLHNHNRELRKNYSKKWLAEDKEEFSKLAPKIAEIFENEPYPILVRMFYDPAAKEFVKILKNKFKTVGSITLPTAKEAKEIDEIIFADAEAKSIYNELGITTPHEKYSKFSHNIEKKIEDAGGCICFNGILMYYTSNVGGMPSVTAIDEKLVDERTQHPMIAFPDFWVKS